MVRAIKSLPGFALLGCMVCTHAVAAINPLGLYVGAGIGDANAQYGFFDMGIPGGRNFDGHQLGWNAVLGIRPIPWIGAEVEYLDFGNAQLGPRPEPSQPAAGSPSSQFFGASAHARAAAAFAVGYLPLPLPGLDLFGKLGLAHVWAPYSYAGYYPSMFGACQATTCAPVGQYSQSVRNNDNSLAYGAGAQFSFGPLAVRAEYERINYPTGDPNLLSVGVTWTF